MIVDVFVVGRRRRQNLRYWQHVFRIYGEILWFETTKIKLNYIRLSAVLVVAIWNSGSSSDSNVKFESLFLVADTLYIITGRYIFVVWWLIVGIYREQENCPWV